MATVSHAKKIETKYSVSCAGTSEEVELSCGQLLRTVHAASDRCFISKGTHALGTKTHLIELSEAHSLFGSETPLIMAVCTERCNATVCHAFTV